MATETAQVIETAITATAEEWEIPEAAVFAYRRNDAGRKNLRIEIALPDDEFHVLAVTEDDNAAIVQHLDRFGVAIDEMTYPNPRPLILSKVLGGFLAATLAELGADALSVKLRTLPDRTGQSTPTQTR